MKKTKNNYNVKITIGIVVIICVSLTYYKYGYTRYYTYDEAMKLSLEERQNFTPKQVEYMLFNSREHKPQATKIIPHNPENNGDDSVEKDLNEYYSKNIDTPKMNYSNVGLSENGAKIMHERNAKKTIKISDYNSPEEREELLAALEIRKNLEFLELNEKEANDMYNIQNGLHSGQPPVTSLDFIPSKLPNEIDEYKYIGYADDMNKRLYSSDRKLPMVRKVFQRNDGTMLILDEETLKNGAEIAIEEFVTKRIEGYPAHIFNLKAPDTGREAVYMKIATEKSQYVMHIVGQHIDFEKGQNELTELAENLIKLNA